MMLKKRVKSYFSFLTSVLNKWHIVINFYLALPIGRVNLFHLFTFVEKTKQTKNQPFSVENDSINDYEFYLCDELSKQTSDVQM